MTPEEIIEALEVVQKMVGEMCKEGRPPKMSIPAFCMDEDVWITNAAKAAIAHIDKYRWRSVKEALPEEAGRYHVHLNWGDRRVTSMQFNFNTGGWFTDGVTHWSHIQPLPGGE